MAKKKIKRCEICSSKLDESSNCTWEECPKNIAKKQEEESQKEVKDENNNG